ncbi:zinc finger protein Xfin-like isoform X2 [Scylla paramamosain]|uniref:zinc finger protein Xfin-like isoform X2 n=1 Tax=Scylla paramamosain TaxID=85552 RepID=UPI003082BD94
MLIPVRIQTGCSSFNDVHQKMAQLLKKDLYYCKACQSSFSRYTKLQHHMASHTVEENLLYGDVFSCTWSSPKKQVKQVKQVKQAEHHCPVCQKRYLHSGYYKKHMWNAHGGHVKSIPGSVSKSEKVSDGYKDPVKFMRGRRRDRTPITTECRKRKYYECSVCRKMMTQSSTLKAHKRIHTGERPYQCPICSKTFTFYQCLWNHSWSHKTRESFPCDKCPRKFRYYQTLWNHYKVHTDDKLFACDMCKMRFTNSRQLMYHMKEHPEYFKVKIKSFGTRDLRTSDTNEMPFICEICCRSFRLKVSLTSHMEKCHSFSNATKSQMSFQRKEKYKNISLQEDNTGPAQKPKRGRGRPRKYIGLEEVKRNVNSKHCKIPMKQYHICPNCNKISTYCVCNTVLKSEQVCKLSPPTYDFNGKNQIHHPQCENETSFDLNARIEDFPRNSFSDQNIFPKSSLRRSGRLRGERVMMLDCKTCQLLTSTSEHRKHLKQHAITSLYKCQHCSKNYKSKSWLSRHQYLVHRDTQRDSLKKDRLIKKLDGKNTCTCSFCGTKFLSCSDYKDHIIFQSCTCGQQFQCAYIFCFHASKCKLDNPAWEGKVGQNRESGDPTLIFSSEESVHDDLMNQSSNTLATEETREVSQMFTDELTKDIDTNDCLLSSVTSADLYHSERWCMQHISDSYSSKNSPVIATIDQAKQNSSSDTGDTMLVPQHPWFVPQDPLLVLQDPLLVPGYSEFISEASERSVLNSKVRSCEELDNLARVEEKQIDIKYSYQCILCGQRFSCLSELTTHSVNHVSDQGNLE